MLHNAYSIRPHAHSAHNTQAKVNTMSKRRIPLTDAQIRAVVDKTIENSEVMIDGELRIGMSETFLVAMLRDMGFSISGSAYWFCDELQRLGYNFGRGKVGKWTRTGYQYCVPARCIYI